MTTLKRNHSKRIYFFDNSDRKSNYTNGLKDFIYFLKSKGIYENIDFSYANAEDSLHRHLTIKENFILDAIPTSLIKESETNLSDFIASIQNIYLKDLILKLGDLNQTVTDLDQKKIKLTSIIKVILSTSKYIFLNKPDELLEHKELEQIKKCLEFEVEHNSRIVLFNSNKNLLWPELVTNIVTKNDKQIYHDAPNPLHQPKQTENTPFTYNFTLNKKVS